MARRGRKKKFRLNLKLDLRPDVVKSLLAVGFVLLGLLGLLSFFASDYFLNSKIRGLLVDTFGTVSFFVPFLLIFTGLLFIESIKSRLKNLRVWLGLLGFLVSLSGFLGVIGGNAGILGEKLSDVVATKISGIGAGLLFFGILFISFMLVSSVSLDQIISLASKFLSKAKKSKTSEPEKEEIEKKEKPLPIPEKEPVLEHPAEPKKPEKKFAFEVISPLSEPQLTGVSEYAGLPKEDTSLNSIAPTLPYSDRVWELPPLDLLEEAPATPPNAGDVRQRAQTIKDTLKSFGIDVEIKDIQKGPTVTQYSLEAATGTKISKIAALQYDLALALASPTGSVRIEAPIPGKSLIGIEVPNYTRTIVSLKSLLTSEPMKAMKTSIATVLGKDVAGQTYVYDIGKMPHMLVAGSTGSGKSIFLHSLIFSILFRAGPHECKFILVDPKRVEFTHYADTPHLWAPIITEVDRAAAVFKWAVIEMERRYKIFESAKVRNIDAYNEKSGFQALPYIVIIVDELGEIMVADPALVEKSIIRLAQLARATGIHLILSVQRPSTNVITGLIKANIPCRIAFNVSSQIDSRVIIDQPGAEKLLGKGDMLFLPPDAAKPTRLQGAWVSDREIANLVNYLKAQGVAPDYRDDIFESAAPSNRSTSVAGGGDLVDDLFGEAVEIVSSAGKASASLLQRRLSIGYARAARILDELEAKGVIGPAQGSKPRDVFHEGESLPQQDFTSDIISEEDF